jgi:hypothetical protein
MLRAGGLAMTIAGDGCERLAFANDLLRQHILRQPFKIYSSLFDIGYSLPFQPLPPWPLSFFGWNF